MDPVYFCLDCSRERLAILITEGDDLHGITAESIPDDGVFRECGDCGKALPESKKRELKAENLVLRAKLDVANRAVDTCVQYIAVEDEIKRGAFAALMKYASIADAAIELAHELWIAREAFADMGDEALGQLIDTRERLSVTSDALNEARNEAFEANGNLAGAHAAHAVANTRAQEYKTAADHAWRRIDIARQALAPNTTAPTGLKYDDAGDPKPERPRIDF